MTDLENKLTHYLLSYQRVPLSIETILNETGFSKRSFYRALSNLISLKFFEKVRVSKTEFIFIPNVLLEKQYDSQEQIDYLSLAQQCMPVEKDFNMTISATKCATMCANGKPFKSMASAKRSHQCVPIVPNILEQIEMENSECEALEESILQHFDENEHNEVRQTLDELVQKLQEKKRTKRKEDIYILINYILILIIKINARACERVHDHACTCVRTCESEKTKKASTRFIPPTEEQVAEYCQEYCLKKSIPCNLDQALSFAEDFCNHYESKGWMIGKTKAKDWHKLMATWFSGGKNPLPYVATTKPLQYQNLNPNIKQPKTFSQIAYENNQNTLDRINSMIDNGEI